MRSDCSLAFEPPDRLSLKLVTPSSSPISFSSSFPAGRDRYEYEAEKRRIKHFYEVRLSAALALLHSTFPPTFSHHTCTLGRARWLMCLQMFSPQDWMSHKVSLDETGNIKSVQGVAHWTAQKKKLNRLGVE